MQAIQKKVIFREENIKTFQEEDIQFMEDFLESLENSIRSAKFSSERERISRRIGYRQYKGKRTKKNQPNEVGFDF
jgi:hypothetical protein